MHQFEPVVGLEQETTALSMPGVGPLHAWICDAIARPMYCSRYSTGSHAFLPCHILCSSSEWDMPGSSSSGVGGGPFPGALMS